MPLLKKNIGTEKSNHPIDLKTDVLIHAMGYISGNTGYNIHTRNFFTQLQHFFPLIATDLRYPDQLEPNINQCFQSIHSSKIINIHINYGRLMSIMDVCFGKKIGYTVWESTRIPDDWILPLQNVDEIWIPTHWGKQVLIENGFQANHIHVVPEGVDPDIFHPEKEPFSEIQSLQGFKFLHVGKYEERKGTKDLIIAFDNVFRDCSDVLLILACHNFFIKGFDIQKELTQLQLVHPEKIIPISPIAEHKDLARLYVSCDAFVSPFKAEGWGLPIIEAMSCGLPVIITNYSGPTEYTHADNAYLIDYHLEPIQTPYFLSNNNHYGQWASPDLDHLMYLMKHVYCHQEQARLLGMAASKEIRNHWTWHHAAKKAYQIINQSLSPELSINSSIFKGKKNIPTKQKIVTQPTQTSFIQSAKVDLAVHTDSNEQSKIQEKSALSTQCLENIDQTVAYFSQQAMVYHNQNKLEEAIACYQHAIALKPNHEGLFNNLGSVYSTQNRIDMALDCFIKASELNPTCAEIMYNIADMYHRQYDLNDAISYYQKAIELKPDMIEAYYYIGIALSEQGKLDHAIKAYQQAVDLDPTHLQYQINLAYAFMQRGDIHVGFKLIEKIYEKKFQKIKYDQPIWNGESINDKIIYIHNPYGGFGDMIHLIRYAMLIKNKGCRSLIVSCHPLLVQLIKSMPCIDQVFSHDASMPHYDIHAPLHRLPYLFKTDLTNIPTLTPYLYASEQTNSELRTIIRLFDHQLKIGIVWSGGPANPKRSCPLKLFKPLFDIHHITWFSIQTGDAINDLMTQQYPIVNLGKLINNFAHTAVAIHHMDLIISIDTATAHLAGAMHKPIWMMLPYSSDWRWFRNREDSPWYPSMRLFRQTIRDDWQHVIQRIFQKLHTEFKPPFLDQEKALSYYDQAVTLHLDNQLDMACDMYKKAIISNPELTDAYHFMGNALRDLGHKDAALYCYNKTITIHETYAGAFFNSGITYQQLNQYDQAILCYQKTGDLVPDCADAFYNLGIVYDQCRRFEDAIYAYKKAIQISPDHVMAHYNLGTLYLKLNDLNKGLKEYEWRQQRKDFKKHAFSQPYWKGESFKGKSLLIWVEQGFGDTIQFIRYVSLVKPRGGQIIVICQPEMARLLKTVSGIDQVITAKDIIPQIDYQIPLLSLPYIFKTQHETIPNQVPYFFPSMSIQSALYKKIHSYSKPFKIGLVWISSPTDPKRSCALDNLLFLGQVEDCNLFGFQLTMNQEDITVANSLNIIDLGQFMKDFYDTASAVQYMNLVITVDTAVAHLAGAMGIPVWLMLHYDADWRWLLDRSDSPWYPTMKLYRQVMPESWDHVIQTIEKDLIDLLQTQGLHKKKIMSSPPKSLKYKNKVSIIIPVYNGYQFLEKLLISIDTQTQHDQYEVIIIDDASDQENMEPLYRKVEQNKKVKVIRNTINLGFAKSNNVGFHHATGEYVYLINSDTLVMPGWLQASVHLFQNSAQYFPGQLIGAIQSKIILPDENNTEQVVQTCGSMFNSSGWPVYHYHRYPATSSEVNQLMSIDSFMGCGVMILKQAIDQVKGFDETFGKYYFEDTDLSLRICEKGYSIVYYPLSTIIHFHGVSTSFYVKDETIFQNNLKSSKDRFKENGLKRKSMQF